MPAYWHDCVPDLRRQEGAGFAVPFAKKKKQPFSSSSPLSMLGYCSDLSIEKMTTMLTEVVVVVKEMSRDVQFIKSELADARFTPGGHRGPAPGTTLEMTPTDLLIMNEDNFNEAESSLKNESVCQSMIARLALVGGTSSDSMIRRMLSPALTNFLACHFNWAGKGNKQPFSRTVMQGCMFALPAYTILTS
ncbi:hypothetical protein ABVT39_022276 [Epinephelus coioides]